MSEFHRWVDIRSELDDGDSEAPAVERARTEAWVNAFHLAQGRYERADARVPHSNARPRLRRSS